MRASELATWLHNLIQEYGDREVFSECDWDYVGTVDVDDEPRDTIVATSDHPMGDKKIGSHLCFTLRWTADGDPDDVRN